MKKNYHLLSLSLLFAFAACKNEKIDVVNQEIENPYEIRAHIKVNSVWTPWAPTDASRTGSDKEVFMCYMFKGNNCYSNRGNYMDQGMTTTLRAQFFEPGTYPIYCVTGWTASEFLTNEKSLTLDTELPITAVRDFCLGKTDAVLTEQKPDVDINIQVDHIMSKAAFTITDVPDNVKDIQIILPHQANKFKFDGTLLGNAGEQTITLDKGENNAYTNGSRTMNSKKYYDWAFNECIVYPSASNSTTMDINVKFTIYNNEWQTIETTTSTPCVSGKRYKFTASWDELQKYIGRISVTTQSWNTEIQNGTFSKK